MTILRLYNSVPDNHDRDYVVNACSEVDKDVFECISISDVINTIHGLKTGKSAGPNGLVNESFKNSGMKLCVHLSLLYILYVLGAVFYRRVLRILTLFLLLRTNAEILLILIIIVQLHCVMLKPKSWKKSFFSKVLSYSDHDKYQFGFGNIQLRFGLVLLSSPLSIILVCMYVCISLFQA